MIFQQLIKPSPLFLSGLAEDPERFSHEAFGRLLKEEPDWIVDVAHTNHSPCSHSRQVGDLVVGGVGRILPAFPGQGLNCVVVDESELTKNGSSDDV